jgi:hypothetical protein
MDPIGGNEATRSVAARSSPENPVSYSNFFLEPSQKQEAILYESLEPGARSADLNRLLTQQ